MVPLSPSLLVASASSFAGITQSPRTYLAEIFRHAPPGGDEEMWGLHFVQHVGAWSHLDFRKRVSSWPLPATRFVNELVALAAKKEVLHNEAPIAGDVFALWSPSKQRHVRVGIIVDAAPTPTLGPGEYKSYECSTIECVLHEVDGAITRSVVLRERRLNPSTGDRFIRWTDMRPGNIRFTEAA